MMNLVEFRDRLLPGPEHDRKFREMLERLARQGLRTLALLEFLLPFAASRASGGAALLLLAIATFTLSRTSMSRRHARVFAAFSVTAAAAPLTLALAANGADPYVLTALGALLLGAVAVIPFRPVHAFGLGVMVDIMYFLSCRFILRQELSSDSIHSCLLLLAVAAGVAAAANYRLRRFDHDANQETIRRTETLTGAQLRAELAESAISIGKMAAALSHELNSPLGALRSSTETLLEVTDRLLVAPPEVRERLIATREELRGSIVASSERILEVSTRLRRFVNLEEAEVKPANLNELLSDVTILHQDELRDAHVRLEFDFEEPLPQLSCRPQLLTAVFSTLLSNAIQAVNGDGRVDIRTRRIPDHARVEVTVRDNGRGMTQEQANTIFDPTFKADGTRVASGNWSLFNSRQIVYEHGGEIRVETAPGEGTAVFVTLPLPAPQA